MVHVFDYGAAGDGQTDDTAALQHALEAGDGLLQLHKGTYRITRPLVLNLPQQGYGAVVGESGTSRILMAGPGPAIQVLGDHGGTADPRTVKPHTWDRERLPIVRDLEIVGAHADAVGIELRRSMQATVTRVLVRNCRHGIHLVERNRNVVISDSHLYDNSEFGLFLDNCDLHQINVHGNHISYNKKAGIKSYQGDVHNFQIVGNDIEYNNHPGVDESPNGEPTGAEIWFEVPEGRISEVTIVGNTIQATIQPGGANIRIHGIEENPPLGAVLFAITGNVIGSQTRGIELRNAQRIAISGNTIYGNAELSILAVHCAGMSVGSNTISWQGRDSDPPHDGLRFEDCHSSAVIGLVANRLCAGTPEDGAGITLVRCRDFSIAECQLTNPLHRGIELVDCHGCRVANNSIVDSREQPTMRQAIRVVGNGTGNLVQGNFTSGATIEPLEIAEQTAIVTGNTDVPRSADGQSGDKRLSSA
jgi:parallel beta-helix repeat protein